MANQIDYNDLVSQKIKLISKLNDLDAEQFGAISLGEMNRINMERSAIEAALSAINKILNPKTITHE